jgi:hypothetical protein
MCGTSDIGPNVKSGAAHAPHMPRQNTLVPVSQPRPPPNHLIRPAIEQGHLLRDVPERLPGLWWALQRPFRAGFPHATKPNSVSGADTLPDPSFKRGKGCFRGLHQAGAYFQASIARGTLHQPATISLFQSGDNASQMLIPDWIVTRIFFPGPRSGAKSSRPKHLPGHDPNFASDGFWFLNFTRPDPPLSRLIPIEEYSSFWKRPETRRRAGKHG